MGARSPSERRTAAVGGDLVLPILAVAFAIYFFYSVWDLSWEAKANAVIIGAVLLGLVAIFAVRVGLSLIAGTAILRFDELIEPRRILRDRLMVIALPALFVVVLPWLGLTLGLFLLVTALMLALRAGSIRSILLTAGIVAGSAYLLFMVLLSSRLPRGPFEKLVSALI